MCGAAQKVYVVYIEHHSNIYNQHPSINFSSNPCVKQISVHLGGVEQWPTVSRATVDIRIQAAVASLNALLASTVYDTR